MTDNQYSHELNEVSPEQLLVVFSRGRIVLWATVAILIHVVVIGVTSVGYIRDRWIDPEGAKVRKEAAAAALAAEKAKAKPVAAVATGTNAAVVAGAATNGIRGGATGAVATATATGTGAVAAATGAVATAVATTNAASNDENGMLESRRDTAVVKRITDKASSNDIPRKPDLGISLEETNPH